MDFPRKAEIYAFLSDNTAPMTPECLAALSAANDDGALPGYGADYRTQAATEAFSQLFGAPVSVAFTSTGTAANALALATLCPPWKRVLCQRYAHIMETEAGAPEAFGGGLKLSDPGHGAQKVTPADIHAAAGRKTPGDPHTANFGTVSISQTTETGLVYSPAEVIALAGAARHTGLAFHIDGARLANALVATNASAAQMGAGVGTGAISFGLAKNGAALGDAVVLFDPDKAEELRFRQMRAGHLMSKGRYIAAQACAALRNGLWLERAAQANDIAGYLGRNLSAKGYDLATAVESNQIFVQLPQAMRTAMTDAGYPVKTVAAERFGTTSAAGYAVVRLVTAWNSTRAAADAFLKCI